MSVNLGDAEPEFRSWVAETLDAALQLRNDKPSRTATMSTSPPGRNAR